MPIRRLAFPGASRGVPFSYARAVEEAWFVVREAGSERGPRAFHSGWMPPHPTFFCWRALYDEFGGFDPRYRIAGDFEFMLRLIERHGIRVRYVPRPFVRMRVGGRANTLRGIIQGNREIVHAFRANGLEFSSRFFCTKLVRKLRQLVWRPSLNVLP